MAIFMFWPFLCFFSYESLKTKNGKISLNLVRNEKIPQQDVSQMQAYIIIIKLRKNLDGVEYNVN